MTNIWSKFISTRKIDGKNKRVIVDICGDIVNRNPKKEEVENIGRHLSIRQICNLPKEEKREFLLEFLRIFYDKNGRSPKEGDFIHNNKYPSFMVFQREFDSYINALIEAGFEPNDAATRGRQGELQQLAEFKTGVAIDLSGQNWRSPVDGICPHGAYFDTKCSSLVFRDGYGRWKYNITENQLRDAKYIFLRAYADKDFTKHPLYRWRVPIEFFVDKKTISIYKEEYGSRRYHRYNVENMKEFEISIER